MKIKFHGDHNTQEAYESLLGILELFHERYGIETFHEMRLQVTLQNDQGEDVELVDANTSEVLEAFEVYKDMPKSTAKKAEVMPEKGHLKLVVDNTKG